MGGKTFVKHKRLVLMLYRVFEIMGIIDGFGATEKKCYWKFHWGGLEISPVQYKTFIVSGKSF